MTYMTQLTMALKLCLVKSQIGCQIGNVCVNHVMYADDICLMAPSPAALQKLFNICYDFSLQNNLTFNSPKSFCMVFKRSRLYKLSCPTFYINNETIDYTDSIKYLHVGFTFSSDKKDDNDMPVQKSTAYTWLDCCCSTQHKLYSLLLPPAMGARKSGLPPIIREEWVDNNTICCDR